jgi:hypothetical protein
MRKLVLISTFTAVLAAKEFPGMIKNDETDFPNNDHCRALDLLASCPNGCTETTLLVEHNHSSETIVDLIRAGLATLQTKHLGKPITTARVKITAKGRLALGVPRAKIETRDEAVNAALKVYPHLTYEEAEEITKAFGLN